MVLGQLWGKIWLQGYLWAAPGAFSARQRRVWEAGVTAKIMA